MKVLYGTNCKAKILNYLRLELVIVLSIAQKQAVYYKRNIETRSCKNCCRGKAINIKYKCVSVASATQHVKCMRRIK